MRNSRRQIVKCRAFCAFEVLIILVLVSIALMPMLSLRRSGIREADVSTASYLAHARVQTLLDAQEAMGWTTNGSVNKEITQLETPAGAGQPPEELVKPAACAYRETLEIRRLDRDLVALAVEVSWQPATPGGRKKVRSMRVLARPDVSWLAMVPLGLDTSEQAVTD